jgi:type III restriction enzyme
VRSWRALPQSQRNVTPSIARLLRHWRSHEFQNQRPFLCQIEAVETVIWLTEVAPKLSSQGRRFWAHLEAANATSNPELLRLALKLATRAGKTTVMAMLIAWQTVNAARHPDSKRYSKGSLIGFRLHLPKPELEPVLDAKGYVVAVRPAGVLAGRHLWKCDRLLAAVSPVR